MLVYVNTGVLHDTEHQMMQDKELDLLEGSDLNSSCELMGLTIDFDVVACLTRNKSDKIERILNNTLGNCVQFSNNVCTQHFNNSLAKIQVSMFEDKNGYCSPLQVTNFIKKSITLHDNGLVILCGFHGLNNNIKRYASLRLRVHSHERPNYYFVLYALITGLVTSVVLFVTIIIIVIIYKRGKPVSTSMSKILYTFHYTQAILKVRYLQGTDIVSVFIIKLLVTCSASLSPSRCTSERE